MTQTNYIKFKFQCPEIKLYWSMATLTYGCFWAINSRAVQTHKGPAALSLKITVPQLISEQISDPWPGTHRHCSADGNTPPGVSGLFS